MGVPARPDPAAQAAGGSLPDHPACAFCGTTETELVNPFGGQLSVAQYWCLRCRTGFEYVKWGTDRPPA